MNYNLQAHTRTAQFSSSSHPNLASSFYHSKTEHYAFHATTNTCSTQPHYLAIQVKRPSDHLTTLALFEVFTSFEVTAFGDAHDIADTDTQSSKFKFGEAYNPA